MRLSADEIEKLQALNRCTGYNDETCGRLELLGLVTTGRSRFGRWAKITEAGRDLLASVLPPGSRDGAGREAGYSYRGAVPRNHGDTATQARGSAAIPPPAAVLDVGAGLQPEGPADQVGMTSTVERKLAPLTMKQIVDRITEMVVTNGKSHSRTSNRGAE